MGSSINFMSDKESNDLSVWKFGDCIGNIEIEMGCHIDKEFIEGTAYIFQSYNNTQVLYSSELQEILNKIEELNGERK